MCPDGARYDPLFLGTYEESCEANLLTIDRCLAVSASPSLSLDLGAVIPSQSVLRYVLQCLRARPCLQELSLQLCNGPYKDDLLDSADCSDGWCHDSLYALLQYISQESSIHTLSLCVYDHGEDPWYMEMGRMSYAQQDKTYDSLLLGNSKLRSLAIDSCLVSQMTGSDDRDSSEYSVHALQNFSSFCRRLQSPQCQLTALRIMLIGVRHDYQSECSAALLAGLAECHQLTQLALDEVEIMDVTAFVGTVRQMSALTHLYLADVHINTPHTLDDLMQAFSPWLSSDVCTLQALRLGRIRGGPYCAQPRSSGPLLPHTVLLHALALNRSLLHFHYCQWSSLSEASNGYWGPPVDPAIATGYVQRNRARRQEELCTIQALLADELGTSTSLVLQYLQNAAGHPTQHQCEHQQQCQRRFGHDDVPWCAHQAQSLTCRCELGRQLGCAPAASSRFGFVSPYAL